MELLAQTEGGKLIDSFYYFFFDSRKQFVAITLEADGFFFSVN
jgi:hypothetical protein